MYESFYGLQRDPFRLRPEAHFAFRYESYARARNQLEYALFRGEGVVLISGAPGSGKSTLVEDLLEQHEGLQVARIDGTHTDAEAFMRLVAFALGATPGADRAASLIEIQRCLQESARAGRRALLIVDNAQELPLESIEELRVLTGGDGEWELQVLLLGGEALREIVQDERFESMRQRIIASCELEALSEQNTRDYIRHRLEAAGANGSPELSDEACNLIHHYSNGNPRRINMLCARLLLKGFAEDRQLFNSIDVRNLGEQLETGLHEADPGAESPAPRALPRAAAHTAAATQVTHSWSSSRAERVPVVTDVVDEILAEGTAPRWKPPSVPLGFTIDTDAERQARARHLRARPAQRSRAARSLVAWLSLGLLLSIAVVWFAGGISVDRGGSGWQRFQGALTDYIERALGR